LEGVQNPAGETYFLFCDGQGWGYSQALIVEKEPIGDDAVVKAVLDGFLDQCCISKVNGHPKSGASNFFDGRVYQKFSEQGFFLGYLSQQVCF
jgi:hypothetical protein